MQLDRQDYTVYLGAAEEAKKWTDTNKKSPFKKRKENWLSNLKRNYFVVFEVTMSPFQTTMTPL